MNISAARMLSLLVALLVGTGSGIAAAQDVPAAAIPELVRPATAKAAPAATDARAGKGVVRSRPIDLDVAALKRAAVRTGPDPAPSLSITFFDDAATAVAITRTERIGSNGTAYIGTVPGVPYSSVVIVEEDGVISGNVDAGGARYQIRNFGPAGHRARQVDDAAFPAEAPPIPINAPPLHGAKDDPKATPAAVSAPADDGSQIDVMVVYTPAARVAQGGTSAMMSLVNLGITETNNAYTNSNVIQRIRLVYAGEVNYTEVDSNVDLDRLQATNDGWMDQVHALRDTYGADLVSLWGNYGDVCGRGFMMDPESSGFADHAFHIVDADCATGNYSFGHELGHNMGLRHDNYIDPDTVGLTAEGSAVTKEVTYAHGYIDLTNHFRTVMAYDDQCSAAGFKCKRIAAFSNPAVTYNNSSYYAPAVFAPIGDATTAHERRALNDTRETTANFRKSGGGGAPNLAIAAFTAASTTVAAGATITLSATVASNGTTAGTASTLRYYVDNGAGFTEIAGCADAIGALAPGASSAQNCTFAAGATTGVFSYRVAVDAVAGETASSDNTSAVVTVKITDPGSLDWTDLWYTPSESGWGINFVQNSRVIFATFFIYGANATPTWYVAALDYDNAGRFAGKLYTAKGTYFGAPWNPANGTAIESGTATFTPNPANAYQGTLAYTVIGSGSVTKSIERQSLTRIVLGGSYVGGTTGGYADCNTAANSRRYRDQYTLDVTHAGNNATFVFTYSDKSTCTFAGALVQHGLQYSMPSAAYTCSGGLNTTATLSEIKATSLGIEGRLAAPSTGGGCREFATFEAVLR